MVEDKPPGSNGGGLAWFRRLSHAISGEPRNRNDLREVIRDAQQRGLIDNDGLAMLEGVLEVSEMQVRDIMVPRPHMVVVERDARPDMLAPIIIESGHSRFPVIGDDRDEIVGILLAKDLLRFYADHEDSSFDIRDYLRRPVFIPESKRLNVLLKEFRDSHNHMAIVVDEYGGVSGLVTIEDVIEQITGDIDDEHDIEEDALIQKESDDRYTVKALTRIDEFNQYFATEFSDEEYDTIGGLVIHELGRLPRRGEEVRVGDYAFKILRATRRRIDVLQVTPAPPVGADPVP